ncbi:patj homolog [Hetaerina americana]|uniref:patj homolog n=1 Tax=Hetaerina americana TaxID=62018 RepID=UPI003A7F4DD3
MPLSGDISTALQLLEHIQHSIHASEDVKLESQTSSDLNLLISVLENPVLRGIVTIQDSLCELNQQLQHHPSILPADFEISPAGELVLSLPPSPPSSADIYDVGVGSRESGVGAGSSGGIGGGFEFEDQRVPVATLSNSSSSGENVSSPQPRAGQKRDGGAKQRPGPHLLQLDPRDEGDDDDILEEDDGRGGSLASLPQPPITTTAYAMEFQKAIGAASQGRDVHTIKLFKPEGSSLGFSVVGLRSEEKGELGIFVQEIQPTGIAGRDGRLQEGDQILAIDGQPLDSNISHHQAISILQKARGLVELVVARNAPSATGESTTVVSLQQHLPTATTTVAHPPSSSPPPPPPPRSPTPTSGTPASSSSLLQQTLPAATIERSPSAVSDGSKAGSEMVLNTEWAQVEVIDLLNDGSGLGFGIIGGRSTGVVVKTILPTGVADRDGRLQSGDHILQIGDVNLRGMGSEQVAAVLRQSGSHVRLVVARPVEPTSPDYQALGSHAPIVPTKILGDPEELDRQLLQNGYDADAAFSGPPPPLLNSQQPTPVSTTAPLALLAQGSLDANGMPSYDYTFTCDPNVVKHGSGMRREPPVLPASSPPSSPTPPPSFGAPFEDDPFNSPTDPFPSDLFPPPPATSDPFPLPPVDDPFAPPPAPDHFALPPTGDPFATPHGGNDDDPFSDLPSGDPSPFSAPMDPFLSDGDPFGPSSQGPSLSTPWTAFASSPDKTASSQAALPFDEGFVGADVSLPPSRRWSSDIAPFSPPVTSPTEQQPEFFPPSPPGVRAPPPPPRRRPSLNLPSLISTLDPPHQPPTHDQPLQQQRASPPLGPTREEVGEGGDAPLPPPLFGPPPYLPPPPPAAKRQQQPPHLGLPLVYHAPRPFSFVQSSGQPMDPSSSVGLASGASLTALEPLPEMEKFEVELRKDAHGLGITIAGYVCEKEELSGIFVKSISEGSAADLCGRIQVNDRIVEVDGRSLQGYTNHGAVEVLRGTGRTVRLCLERYLRGPKYEQLQQAIANSELLQGRQGGLVQRQQPLLAGVVPTGGNGVISIGILPPPTPSSPSATSLPHVPLSSTDGEDETTEIEPEGESHTTIDSAVLLEGLGGGGEDVGEGGEGSRTMMEALNMDVDVERLITTSYDGELDSAVEAAVKAKWSKIMGPDCEIVVAQLSKFGEGGGLGISLEGTVDVEGGREVRPHHYIRSILPEGPVGRNGRLRSGDELLEVNGCRLLGLNHVEVVANLKELPVHVRMVCARKSADAQPQHRLLIDTAQDRAAFAARSILGGSLQNLLPSTDRLVKAKSDGSLASSSTATATASSAAHTPGAASHAPTTPTFSSPSSSSAPGSSSGPSADAAPTSDMSLGVSSGGLSAKMRSRSLEPLTGLAMWSSEPQVIELIKGERGLGFSILDYQDPMNPSETVIVIRSLVPGGVAQTDGRLVPGDRLLAVNDSRLENASLDRAVQALKGAPRGVVRIAVAKPLPLLPASEAAEDDNYEPEQEVLSSPYRVSGGQVISGSVTVTAGGPSLVVASHGGSTPSYRLTSTSGWHHHGDGKEKDEAVMSLGANLQAQGLVKSESF